MAVLRPGDRIGRFRLERRLGGDSAAQVWVAIDKASGSLDRTVRLHLFPAPDGGAASTSSASSLTGLDPRLVAARRQAPLVHANLAEVRLMGIDAPFAWIATSWADGQTLDALLTRFDAHGLVLPRSAVLEIGIQVARGLAALHEARDPSGEPRPLSSGRVSLAEVWMTKDGRAQLAPFSLGRPAAEMSVARGRSSEAWKRPNDPGTKADLFALGALLFRLATGAPAHDGTDAEALRGQASAPLPDETLGKVRGALPEIADIVISLLARAPDDRPESARQVAGQLVERLASLPRPTDLAGLGEWLALLDARSSRERAGLVAFWPATEDPDWLALRDAARRTLGGTPAPIAPPSTQVVEASAPQPLAEPEEEGFFARLKGLLTMSLSDLFTSPKKRKARQQAAFFLSVAEGMEPTAMHGTDAEAWHQYYDELGRAILADEACFEAYWLRGHAPLHFFRSLRPDRRSPRTREIARRWDADLRWLLTNFPDEPPEGTSLAAARDLRGDFERLCRGLERG